MARLAGCMLQLLQHKYLQYFHVSFLLYYHQLYDPNLSVNSSGWRPRRRAGARTGLCNLLKATRCLKLSLLITDNITSSLTFFHKLNPIVIKLLIYSSSSSAGCPKQDLRTRSCVLRSHRYKYINSKSAEKASKLVASW